MKSLHGVVDKGAWSTSFNKIFNMTDCRVDSITNSRTIQTTPSNSLKLIEFETYYIKSNPPLYLHQQSTVTSRLSTYPN